MGEPGWTGDEYLWDPYRLTAVQDLSATALHSATQQLGTEPDSLVPPVLPGPALPSAISSRSTKAMCKVEGCQRLLADEKPYYQRFMVCEDHMRCLSLDINGQLSRFCQQCGKFEPVDAFDDNKRSCRMRLQEHNKRRRKMGVTSRSLRKHRRQAAAVTKANKAKAAAAAGEAARTEEHADTAAASAGVDSAGGGASEADAAVQSASPSSSLAPAAAAPGASGAPPAAAALAPPAAAALAPEGRSALHVQAAGMGVPSGQLPTEQQQQQAWPAGDPMLASAPPSPSISELFMGDISMTDGPQLSAAAEAAVAGADQLPARVLPPPVPYETSLLYKPASLQPVQPSRVQAAATAGVGSSTPTGRGSNDRSSSLPAAFVPLVPEQQHARHGLRIGSSCSSSNAAVADLAARPHQGSTHVAAAAGSAAGETKPAAAAAAVNAASTGAADGDGVTPGCGFTEEHRRLLDELLAESAELIGAALQPELPTATAAAVAAGPSKHHRGPTAQQQQHQQQQLSAVPGLPLSTGACTDYAMPLPSVALPPIAHRDDSAEDNRMFQSNSSSDSGGSSVKRHKQRRSSSRRSPGRNTAQELQAMQLMQQQAQYQQLQALQVQLQQSMLASPYGQQPQQQQQHVQQPSMLCGQTGLSNPLQATAQSYAYEQQMQFMQQGGMAAAAASASAAYCAAQAEQGFWGLAAPGVPVSESTYNAAQLQLQQQQQYAMAQCNMMSYGGMPAAGAAAAPGYGSISMGQSYPWIGDTAGAGYGMSWVPQSSGFQQQRLQQQGHNEALSAALAVAQGGGASSSYQPVDSSLRMSVKIHGAEPSQLQPEMLPRLNAVLGSSNGSGSSSSTQLAVVLGMHVECGYMRPGCVHLVLQLRSPADLHVAAEALAAAGRGLDASSWSWALLNSNGSSAHSSSGVAAGQAQQPLSLTVQLGDRSVVLVRDGQPDSEGAAFLQGLLQQQQVMPPLPHLSTAQADLSTARDQLQQAMPQLDAILPCCVSSRSVAANGRCQLVALGCGLADCADAAAAPVVLARCQGVFLTATATPAPPVHASAMLQLMQHARHSSAQAQPAEAAPAESSGRVAADSCATVAIQGLQPYGLVHLEFMQGLLLSESRPLLVVDDDAVAAELQVLQPAVMAGGQRQPEAQQVLVDFGRLLDFRAAAERHAASRAADETAEQGGTHAQQREVRQHSSSAPLPRPLLPVAANGQSDAGPMQAAGTATGESSSSGGSASSVQATPTATPATARLQARPPVKACSSSSLRSSLPFSLPFFAGGRRAGAETGASGSSTEVNRRRSFALETVLRQREMREAGEGDDGGSELSCFPTGRRGGIRASLSFSCRHGGGLDMPESGTVASSTAADIKGSSRSASAPLPPAGKRPGSASSGSSGSSASAALNRRHSFAVENRAQQGSPSPAVAAADAANADSPPLRRRSFGDFVVSRSKSFRAFTRNFACGAFLGDAQQDDEPSCGPGARVRSDPGPRSTSEQQQGACGLGVLGASDQQHDAVAVDDVEEFDGASEDGDSVSSFVPGNAYAQPAGAREHPLLTAEYKALMMDVGVRLLCYFLDRGWAASARMVLTVLLKHAVPVASFPAVVTAVAACGGEGLGLLHRAVRSGQMSAIIEVLGWGVQQQACLAWDSKGPRGLTPLHLLALTGCKSSSSPLATLAAGNTGLQSSLAALVLQTSPSTCSLWFNVRDDAGLTPAQYASSMGGERVNQLASSCLLLRDDHTNNQNRPASSHGSVHRLVDRPLTSVSTAAGRGMSASFSSSSRTRSLELAGGQAPVLELRAASAPAFLRSSGTAAGVQPFAVSSAAAGPSAAAMPKQQTAACAASSSAGPVAEAQQHTLLQDGSQGPAAHAHVASTSQAVCWPSAEPVAVAAATGFSSTTDPYSRPSSRHVASSSRSGDVCSSSAQHSDKHDCTWAIDRLVVGSQQQLRQPPALVIGLAHALSWCQQALDASPELLRGLWVGLQVLRLLWIVLLLEAVLHGSLGLMLVSGASMTAIAMLLRLLVVLNQPALRSSLTNAGELQWQLGLLLRSAVEPLPQPHSWLLAFDNTVLEAQYKQVLAESRQQVDAVISGAIKGLISILPLLVRCGACQYLVVQLLAAPARQWNLPTMHLLAASVAAGLPLIAALLSPCSYNSMRDSVLAATQGLLLVMLRKPLLAAATGSAVMTAGTVAAGAGSVGAMASAQLFHGCIAALLLLLFRQRLCWAAWQAASDAGLGLVLLCWEWASAASFPAMHSCMWSLLQVMLPVLVLPLLYVREKVDRQMALASVLPQKQAEQLKVKEL